MSQFPGTSVGLISVVAEWHSRDMTSTTAFTLTRQSPHFGALVSGVDLSSVDASTAAEIRAALLEHKVLLFTGQSLDAERHIEFANYFGETTSSHPVMPALDSEHPQIWELDSTDPTARNDAWHTDVTFVARPPMGSVLRAVQVPDVGGDTLWADLEQAYWSLSKPVRDLADQLTAEHDGSHEFGDYLAQYGGNDWDGTTVRRLDPVVHPVVRVHPETGRPALFVNPWFTKRIIGVSEAESRGILDLLFAHITKPEHIMRHRWQQSDVAMWDNRNTAHYATLNYGDFRRVMHRVTIAGDVPVGVTN